MNEHFNSNRVHNYRPTVLFPYGPMKPLNIKKKRKN